MHYADLEFQHAQAGRGFTGEQSTTHHTDCLFKVRHFAKRERVADGAQINNVTEVDTCDRRPHWPASHGETSLVKFDALAIAEHGQTTVDVELCDDSAKACLDLVRMVPARIDDRQFLQGRRLFAQETLGEHPALVRIKSLRAD